MDHMLSIAQRGRPFSFYTSEGITIVKPPAGFWKRLRAKTNITFHFSSIAALRNWREDSYWEPSQYVKKLETLGFQFHFRPYEDKAQQDSMVTRFFAGFAFFSDWDTFVATVLTVSKTSILGLSFCILIFCLYFFWHHIRNFRILKVARGSLSVVIGGWGTRGKSSTDRLKGALINGAGIGVFAKTTGCEANITFAGPFQKMHEIPYYRPYGKVSIWEQAQATALANKFKTDVMLWECMAIKPDYVKIMQQQWMISDLSTLTNAFPDHEDLQGPAGYNIAESLLSFLLPHSRLLTAEEQMLPYFQEGVFEKDTNLETVGWLEEGLLTNDILDRFPYKEHAQNITLVLKMAEYFNVSTPVALKEMADEVLPDIGALKIYPIASLNFRFLQFVNGMSANEEYACLTNWHRLGFEQQTPPGVWISTLVNNREDRVARSRVFAQLLVHNLNADRHFIVGTNINGFMGFVSREWNEFLNNLPLSHDFSELFTTLTQKLRICSTMEDLKARLFAMGAKDFEGDVLDLKDLKNFVEQRGDANSEALLRFHQENIKMYEDYHALSQQLRTKPNETVFKETITKWFMSKFILPEKNILLGDDMVSWICEQTPPHYLNKIMGIQNIKGPGLEFVYRWQAWEKCYHAGKLLLNPIPQKVLQGFRILMDLHEFGLLSQEYLKELFPKISPTYEMEMKNLKSYISKTEKENKIKSEEKEPFFMKLIAGFFDINISYNRTNKANKIYHDLSENRISYLRAHEELRKLVMKNNKE
jgi:poly-gamma-glutamate synthase PgsB/CapB